MTLLCDDSAFFSKLSRPALALSTAGVTKSSASRITRSAWSAISRCLEHHNGTRQKCGEHRLAVTRRHAPLPLALVVVEGDLRRRLPPAGHGLIEEPNRRAVLVGGQHLQAPQRVPAPGPVADGLEATSRLVIRVAPSPRLARLQRRRRGARTWA